MEELFRKESLTPNDALRKLLEKPLESKINTDILKDDVVIDIELESSSSISAKIDSKQYNKAFKAERAGNLKSWNELKEKLLQDKEVEFCFNELSSSLDKVEESVAEIKLAEPTFINKKSSDKNLLSIDSKIEKSVEDVLEDPFNPKFLILLFSLMGLGLFVGINGSAPL
jgi:hypothetical protein